MEKAHEPDEQIAERYFLGEMTDAEAEAYEAHYFECSRCAEYVAEEMQMLESGRAVALMEERPAPAPVVNIAEKRKRREWVPLASAAMLVVVIGAPLQLRNSARVTMTTVTATKIPELQFSLNRAEPAAPVIFKAGLPIAMWLSVPSVNAPHVELSVRNAKTKKVITGPKRLSEEELNSSFLMPLSPLPAGSYEVVIEGVREDGNRSTIASQSIEVRR